MEGLNDYYNMNVEEAKQVIRQHSQRNRITVGRILRMDELNYKGNDISAILEVTQEMTMYQDSNNSEQRASKE